MSPGFGQGFLCLEASVERRALFRVPRCAIEPNWLPLLIARFEASSIPMTHCALEPNSRQFLNVRLRHDRSR